MRRDPPVDEPWSDDADDAAPEPGPSAPGAPIDFEAGPDAGGERLDKWLATRLPMHSRSRLQQWIGDGHVAVNGHVAATRQPVWAGDRVRVVPQASADATAFRAEDVSLSIVHEDASLLVIDKPPRLVVHPAAGNWSGTLLNGLLRHDPALAGLPRAGIVHRLDKDTSGLMVVARTPTAQTDLVRQLQARTVGRGYLALVDGTPPATGRIDLAIGRDPRDRLKMAAFPDDRAAHAKPAATRFETLETRADADGRTVSLVACRLETGRTHQIRVHLQAIGHPLVGDPTYGPASRRAPRVAFDRQALHAWRLALVHPETGAAMRWIATPPDDLLRLAAGFDIDLARRVATLAARDD